MIEVKWSDGDEAELLEHVREFNGRRQCARGMVAWDRARILAEIAKHNDIPAHVLRWLVPLVAEGRKP